MDRVLPRLAVFGATTALLGLALVLSTALVAGPLLGAAVRSVDVTTAAPALDRLGERSVVRAADGSVLGALHDEIDRHVVELDAVPEHVRKAVLTAEDRRFYEHDGYDLAGIGRAAIANLRARDLRQGGSTLTQQLAKQNFVGSEKTLSRKAKELVHALALESRFSKEELLERYLNQVYFGRGAYGVAAAAENYFAKDVAELTVGEGALLAALIRSPSTFDPEANPERARQRRNRVLTGMVDEGHLAATAASEARATPLGVRESTTPTTTAPHVVEAVKREFLSREAFGNTRDERIATLFSGGLEIHTTVDASLQSLAGEVIDARFADPDGPTGAIAAVDPRSGRVLAFESGREFERSQFNLATQGRRQPGSAFKPFVLAAALEAGFPPDLRLQGSSPAYFEAVRAWDRDGGGVRNFAGASFGTVDLRTATVRSVNTAYAELITTLGVDPVVDLLGRVGFNVDDALGPAEQRVPAIALGGVHRGVTPLEMASAYGTFATGGEHAEPYLIERITGPDGQTLYEHTSEPVTAVEPAVAAHVTDVLQDVVSRGTGAAAQLPGWQPAGKTGTTQENRDAWFTGYVPTLSTAVWVGHPDTQTSMPGVTGGSVPAQLWKAFMADALAPVEPTGFPDVDADLEELRLAHRVELPDVRGGTLAEAEATLSEARLTSRVRREAAAAPPGRVVWQSPSPGSSLFLGQSVLLGVSTGPRAADSAPPPDASASSPDQTAGDEDTPGDGGEADEDQAPPGEEPAAGGAAPSPGQPADDDGGPSADDPQPGDAEGGEDTGAPEPSPGGGAVTEPRAPLEDGGPADRPDTDPGESAPDEGAPPAGGEPAPPGDQEEPTPE